VDAKTGRIIHFFEQLSTIPRRSKKETLIVQSLQQWAASRQLPLRQDRAGNILIQVAPSLGFENAHSPDERLHIPSILRLWDFLAALLQS
jgi:dipeptidase D